MENTENLKTETLAAIAKASDLKSLDEIRVSVLGKKGAITDMMKGLASLSVEEKKEMGKNLNILKSEIEKALEERKETLAEAELNAKLAQETIDVTLPIRPEHFIRFLKSMKKLWLSLGRWGLMWLMVRILRINSITLMR